MGPAPDSGENVQDRILAFFDFLDDNEVGFENVPSDLQIDDIFHEVPLALFRIGVGDGFGGAFHHLTSPLKTLKGLLRRGNFQGVFLHGTKRPIDYLSDFSRILLNRKKTKKRGPLRPSFKLAKGKF